MKAFNIEAEQAEHIIDSVNEVANRFSVSSADLARNLGNMSAIMAINNVTMEQQIGMLTGVTEITRNASSASRGLVMVSSRLTQVLDDSSSTGKKLTKIYADLGIELKDSEGQLRSHYDILGDLAKRWDTLSENEQKYIALTSAGARQQQNFVALMENWNQVARATATAYESIGSAQRENEKVMDSIAKKVEILKSQFQQLVIGKGGLQNFTKAILDLGISIVKFANSDIGKAVAAFALLEGAIIATRNAWLALQAASTSNVIASAITSLIAGETTLIQVTKVLTASFIENAAAFAATPFGMVTITVAAMAAVGLAIYKYEQRATEAAKKTKELAEAADEAKSEVKNLENELHNIREEIKKVNQEKLKITDSSQLTELQKQTRELEEQEEILKRQLRISQEIAKKADEDAEKQALKAAKTTVDSHFVKPDIYSTDYLYGGGEQVTQDVEIQRATVEIEKFTEARNRLMRQTDLLNRQAETEKIKNGEVSQSYIDLKSRIEENDKAIDEYNNKINSAKAVGDTMVENLQNISEGLKSEGVKEQKKQYEELIDTYLDVTENADETKEKIYDLSNTEEESTEATEEEKEAAEELSKELQNLCQSIGITVTEFRGLQEAFGGNDEALLSYLQTIAQIKQEISDTNTVIDNLQEAMTVAQTALDEYTASGSLTVDTFQSLMKISAQYLTALVNENGQLTINQTTLGNLIEKLKVAKVEELQMAEATDIAAYAQGDLDKMSTLARNSLINVGNAAVTAGRNAEAGAKGFWTLADAIASARQAAGDTDIASDINIQRIHNSYRKLANQISEIKVNTTAAGQAAKSAGKAAKSAGSAAKSAGKDAANAAKEAKQALQDQKKALEDLKSKYDKAIKYIEKLYDKKIDKIKEDKDKALDSVEAQIKALEKEKDATLNTIEKESDALKDLKDARKKYWDEQINALKKANQERKESLELQEKLDALEKAKRTKVKVYKENQGFVYDVDQTAVAQAQKALDEYLSERAYEEELQRLEDLRDAEIDNYEQRLDALDKYKDNVQDSYEKQIENLKEHKQALSDQYDAEIKLYQDYKQQFEDMVNEYEDSQSRLLVQQLTNIDLENDNWMTRLDNLQSFVDAYVDLLKQIEAAQAAINAAEAQTNTTTASTKIGRAHV